MPTTQSTAEQMRASDALVDRANTTFSVLTSMTDSLAEQVRTHAILATKLPDQPVPPEITADHHAVEVALGDLHAAYFQVWTAELAAADAPRVQG